MDTKRDLFRKAKKELAHLLPRYKPSDKLAAVIGTNSELRVDEALKQFFKYAEKNGLIDGIAVKLDDKLKALCEGIEVVNLSVGKISLRDVPTVVTRHLTKI